MSAARETIGQVGQDAPLAVLARLARDAGAERLVGEAERLAQRLGEGRFYVATVGQFKRGKSTLLNALVGEDVLPAGVVPITTAVTVVRYGERLAARVRLADDDWETCDPHGLGAYVSEEQNPGNWKRVTGVEVFVPSPLLESGMCLVDTPGIGSVWEANTAATRAFVPHVDAGLVVLGADPPISGEELALVEEVARQVGELVFVFNKADRQTDAERREATAFTERVLAERLGRSIGPIFHVSATERAAGTGPPRDWNALVERLESLAKRSGADLLRAAEARGLASMVGRLVRELDEQEAALQRPVDESRTRIGALRAALADAEQSLQDLGHRLTAVQERLWREFDQDRDRFFASALPEARRELSAALSSETASGWGFHERAIDFAIEVAGRWLDRWRQQEEPRAEALYRAVTARFVDLVNRFQETLARIPELRALPPLDEAAFSRHRTFFFTAMLTVAPGRANLLLDALHVPGRRRAAERQTLAYLDRLVEVNSSRMKNDFRERVLESRRLLEREIRGRLREVSTTAERALAQAEAARAAGTAAVESRLAWVRDRRDAVERLRAGSEPRQQHGSAR